MREGIFFIVSGPSGSGKTTLTKLLTKRFSDINFAISFTTRRQRPGEVDGVDYRFVSEKGFEEMVQNDRFAEWAVVHGKRYGTPIEELERAESLGVDLIFDLDVQGARNIKNKYGLGVYIFVLPSSFEILKERLLKRESDEKSEIIKRLEDASKEIEEIKYYDYIIINDSLDEALENLASIVRAERCKKDRVIELIKSGY